VSKRRPKGASGGQLGVRVGRNSEFAANCAHSADQVRRQSAASLGPGQFGASLRASFRVQFQCLGQMMGLCVGGINDACVRKQLWSRSARWKATQSAADSRPAEELPAGLHCECLFVTLLLCVCASVCLCVCPRGARETENGGLLWARFQDLADRSARKQRQSSGAGNPIGVKRHKEEPAKRQQREPERDAQRDAEAWEGPQLRAGRAFDHFAPRAVGAICFAFSLSLSRPLSSADCAPALGWPNQTRAALAGTGEPFGAHLGTKMAPLGAPVRAWRRPEEEAPRGGPNGVQKELEEARPKRQRRRKTSQKAGERLFH